MFKPSRYQQRIYNFIEKGKGNAVIDAVAGSGKSTTIVNALKLIAPDEQVLFLAFNKAIVEELKIKVGNLHNVEIRTLHSLGASSIMRSINCKIQADKYRSWVNRGMEYGALKPDTDLDPEGLSQYKSNIFKLIDLIRVNLRNTREGVMDLANKYALDILDNEMKIAWSAIKWGENQMGVIDFTDMIYFPNIKNIRMPKYDWVFIDECQDLNAAQRGMVLQCITPETGRFIAVGDPRQAIYGFAGADIESFNILKSIPNTIELPLSVCYRCDSKIIDLAKELVPNIEARDGAPEGTVTSAKIKDVQDGDMILCRNTAPLAKLCMTYIADGVKAYIKGKDIGLNLINMISKTRRTNILDMESIFHKELNKIAQRVSIRQTCSLSEARESNQYVIYEDKVAAIFVLSEGLTQTRQLTARIEQIFNEGNNQGICLSTIHKAKGLESDRVFIACPDKLYNKWAMKVPWMAEQETNLVYVAYTRAKHYLGFIEDFQY